jgi:hypothetical protein
MWLVCVILIFGRGLILAMYFYQRINLTKMYGVSFQAIAIFLLNK